MTVPADGATTDPQSEAKSIEACVGGTLQVHLWEDRTRGEQWVPSYESAALALAADEFFRTANGNAVEAGTRTFEFRAVAEGTHRLLFEKRLGWKFTAEDRRLFLVRVAEGPKAGRSGAA